MKRLTLHRIASSLLGILNKEGPISLPTYVRGLKEDFSICQKRPTGV
jgi:hypothetical protein